MLKRPYISLIIGSWTCKQLVRNHGVRILHLTSSRGFCVLLIAEVVPKIFSNFNAVAHLVVPVGWGS